jgi:hypothetical protein
LELRETSFSLIKYIECTIQTNRTIERADNERHERNTEVENNGYVVFPTDQLGNRVGVHEVGRHYAARPHRFVQQYSEQKFKDDVNGFAL